MSMRMLFAPANQDGYGESGGAGAVFSPFAVHLALVFTIVASCISSFSVWLHWKNYRKTGKITIPFYRTKRNQQRQVIRILWMVPVYGISTYISLISLNAAFFVDTVRDIYEAFVIYAFFNLLLNKLGGERALIIMLHSRPPSDNFFPGTLWSREIYVGDPYTFLFVKRGILQFVYVKPILAILTMILKVTGNYQEGEISWSSSYVYLTFFYNLSVSLTLWCLMVFFLCHKERFNWILDHFQSFYVSRQLFSFLFGKVLLLPLLVSAGVIPEGEGTEHMSVAIQDFLICLEMIPAAIAHSFSFSYEDYYDHNVHSARMPIMHAIRDSLGLKDVYMDTLDTLRGTQFNYRSFEPSEGVPHIGSSRTSRIMAGLRYSSSTAKKHWLEPAPVSRYLNTGGRGMNGEIVEDEDPLEFDDPNPWDEVEALYEQSRNMVFGDYNYPVIDFRAPLWRQVRRMASPTGSTRSRGYGSTATRNEEQQQNNNGSIQSSKVPIPPQQPILPSSQKRQKRKSKLRTSYVPTPREGCVDVIIEQGKGNYVVVPDIDDHDNVDDASIPPPSSGSSSSSSVGPSQQPKQPQPQQRLLQQSKQTLPFDRTPPPIRQSRSTPQPTVEPSTSPTTTPSQHLSSSSQQQQPSSPSHLQQDTSSIPSTSSFSSPQPHPSFSSPSSNNIYPESSILQQHTNNQHDNRSFWPTENPSSRPNIHDLFNDRHEDEDTDALFNTGNVWK